MSHEKKCRICLVVKDSSEIDKNGRCKSCADIKEADRRGMHYGDLIGERYEQEQEKRAKQEALYRFYKNGRKSEYCYNCAGVIPKGSRFDKFCCQECKTAYEERERDAEARGSKKKRVRESTAKEKYCVQCGKRLVGRQQKFCSEKCKQLNRYPGMNEDDIVIEPVIRRCKWCNGPIIDSRFHDYCCEQCGKEARNARRREKRAGR